MDRGKGWRWWRKTGERRWKKVESGGRWQVGENEWFKKVDEDVRSAERKVEGDRG